LLWRWQPVGIVYAGRLADGLADGGIAQFQVESVVVHIIGLYAHNEHVHAEDQAKNADDISQK